MRRRATALVAVLATHLSAALAQAHAPPEGTDLVWAPGPSEQRFFIRTNRGLLVTEDGGETFRILCNEALGVPTTENPAITFASGGTPLLATVGEGLLRGTPDYCDWQPVGGPVAGLPAVDLVSDPSTPGKHYLVTTRPDDPEGFFVTTDDGGTWTALGPSDVAFTRARVAPSDPDRLYRSGTRLGQSGDLERVVSVSSDGGATWTDHVVPLLQSELQLFLFAVDPADADRIYARAQASSEELPERLLVSTDAGATFTASLTSPDILALTTTPDGSIVWAGSAEGLWRSDDHGATFTLVPGTGLDRLGCLVYHGGDLFACGVADSRFGISISSDQGQTFSRFLDFSEVTEPVSCAPESRGGATCETPFSDWQREVLTGTTPAPSPDAGATAVGAPGTGAQPGLGAPTAAPTTSAPGAMGTSTPTRSSGGSGCTISARAGSTRSGGGNAWLLGLGALGAAVVRRRLDRGSRS